MKQSKLIPKNNIYVVTESEVVKALVGNRAKTIRRPHNLAELWYSMPSILYALNALAIDRGERRHPNATVFIPDVEWPHHEPETTDAVIEACRGHHNCDSNGGPIGKAFTVYPEVTTKLDVTPGQADGKAKAYTCGYLEMQSACTGGVAVQRPDTCRVSTEYCPERIEASTTERGIFLPELATGLV